MKRLLVLLTVVGCLAVAAASAHGSTAFRIAYTRWGNTLQVFTIGSGGGNMRQLTHGSLESADPSYSRDGARIVFSRGREEGPDIWDIWTMNADGSDKRRITFTPRIDERNPSFSPDGSEIAFTTPKGLWLMRSDGSGRHRLVHRNSAQGPFGPASWSPDGATVVVDDLEFERLLIVSVADRRIERRISNAAWPSWSPDGRTIVFARARGDSGSSDLWLINPDGTGLRPLTNTPALFEVFSSWSPDGSQIVVWANRRDHDPDTLSLFVMNADGSGRRALRPTITSQWWGGIPWLN